MSLMRGCWQVCALSAAMMYANQSANVITWGVMVAELEQKMVWLETAVG